MLNSISALQLYPNPMRATLKSAMLHHPHAGEVPAYGIAEAARYLKLAPATLRSWVIGRPYPRGHGTAYFEPLIQLPDKERKQLSFANLIEAHVLRALRQEHSVSIQAVRDALQFAQKKFSIGRLLLSPELRTTAGELFLEKYGQLINLSRSGQMALRAIFADHLERIEWESEMPIRLYPFSRSHRNKLIVIDPQIAFGRPTLVGKGISTAIITERIDAGESVETLTEDYDLRPAEIEAAILYERAA